MSQETTVVKPAILRTTINLDDRYSRSDLPAAVVAAEAIEILAQREQKNLPARFPEDDIIGAAFSGGGIRSATFGLGVLEGLKERGVLPHLDYLSTVSGGGYIGSWLTANCKLHGGWDFLHNVKDNWQPYIRHLRRYSNYLSPRVGFFSADTWSIGTIWIRNMMLVQLTIILGITVLMLVPHLLEPFFAAWYGLGSWRILTYCSFGTAVTGVAGNMLSLHRPDSRCLKHDWWLKGLSLSVVSFALSALLFYASDFRPILLMPCGLLLQMGFFTLLPLGVEIVRQCQKYKRIPSSSLSEKVNYSQSYVQLWVVLPIGLAAFFISGVIWGQTGDVLNFSLYSEMFFHAAFEWIMPLSFVFVSLVLLSVCSLERPLSWGSWLGLILGTVVAFGVLYLELCAIAWLAAGWHLGADSYEAIWKAFVVMPTLLIYAFSIAVVILIGLLGRNSSEKSREWWSRMGAWLGIYGFGWSALLVFSIYGPKWMLGIFNDLSIASASVGGGWIVSTAAGLLVGKSGSTGENGKKSGNRALEIAARLAPFVFIAGLLALVATAVFLLLVNVSPTSDWVGMWDLSLNYWTFLSTLPPLVVPAVSTLSLVLLAIFAARVDINEFSMNSFYRSRLSRCYLGGARLDASEGGIRDPQRFTGFDECDDIPMEKLRFDQGYCGPLPLVNCALNLGGSGDLSVHTRQSANFVLSPLHCGSTQRDVCFTETPGYSGKGYPTLGQAISISGAAASPNMGYHSSPVTAFMLSMFNVRLGWWFANPSKGARDQSSPWFSLRYLLVELFASATPDSKFVMVSDGGHFENLAIYELIRRRAKVIVAADAECDPQLAFEGLGRLIRMCEVDFNAIIDIDVSSLRATADTGLSRSHCAVGKIIYRDRSTGVLIYLKTTLTGAEDTAVKQYRAANPTFPHETTGDQFYNEEQFESYRRLGRDVARNVFRDFQPTHEFLADLGKLYAPTLCTKASFTRHTARLNDLWSSLGSEKYLAQLSRELLTGESLASALPNTLDRNINYFCQQLLQLMEDVFTDIRLDENCDHPDTAGWKNLFTTWARSGILQQVWLTARPIYGERFQIYFESLTRPGGVN